MPAIDLLPPNCEVKKSEKWKSEVIFGSLIFFNLRYIKGKVKGNNNICIKKCTTIFLWEWSSKQVGGLTKNFQKHPVGESFWKNGVQLVDPRGYFWGKISELIFFRKIYRDFSLQFFLPRISFCFFEKNFKGIFLQKKFVKRFPCKFTPWLVLHVLHFIGDFFNKTRPGLARAAFKRDFLNNQKGKLLEKGVP